MADQSTTRGEIARMQEKLGLQQGTNQAIRTEMELEIKKNQLQIETTKNKLKNEKLSKAERAGLEKTLSLHQDLGKVLEKNSASSQAATAAVAGQMGQLIGLTETWKSTIGGSFITATKGAGGFGNALKLLQGDLDKTFTLSSALGNTMLTLKNATKLVAIEMDAAHSSFFRATGGGREYNKVISNTFTLNRQFGVSATEASHAASALYENTAIFTELGPELKQQLVDQVALMNEFGISTTASAQTLDVFTKVLGYSATEAASLSIDLVEMAESIGLPPARLMQELAATAPVLTKYGDQQMEVFEGLQAAAKATGIEIQGLIGIASQYDTFTDAAEAAGRLNAVLGGPYLNSIELLNAEEDERIRMLIEATELTGQSWESLGRFQKQAIASAAGINDMSEANRIFGMSLSEYDSYQAQMRASAGETATLEERARRAQTVFEEFRNVMNSFALAMEPFVKALKEIANALSVVSSAFTSAFGPVVSSWLAGIILGVGALAVVWAKAATAVGMYAMAQRGAAMGAPAALGGGAGKFFAGGQFLPGGGRAPAGGVRMAMGSGAGGAAAARGGLGVRALGLAANPYVLGALGVGALAYGGYRAYQSSQASARAGRISGAAASRNSAMFSSTGDSALEIALNRNSESNERLARSQVQGSSVVFNGREVGRMVNDVNNSDGDWSIGSNP